MKEQNTETVIGNESNNGDMYSVLNSIDYLNNSTQINMDEINNFFY